jgi:hypothetical protein
MAITPTKSNVLGNPTTDERTVAILLALALSGNYGGAATHGDTLSFSLLSEIASDQVPFSVLIFEAPPAGTAPSFYTGIYCPGTTRDNGVVNFSLAGTEFTQGNAYSGALSTAVFFALVTFPAFV